MAETVYRVRSAEDGGPCAVRHPEHGEYVVPNPAQRFTADDPLVTAYPWLFVRDNAASAAQQATSRQDYAPPEWRNRSRSR